MKPQELRIGNIVKTMGNDYDIVVDLLCDSLNTLYSTRGSWMYDDILPVKLTLAILDKNGFIFNPEETYEYEANRFINMPVSLRSQYKEDIKNIELTLCMNQDYMWMVYFDSQLVAVLQYVHELQNLYFSHTGEELKIEL